MRYVVGMDDHILLPLAERRIREAQERGEFDDLPGAGRPIPEATAPYEEMWWVRRWLERERLRSTDRD